MSDASLSYDIGIAWTWPYDDDFVRLIRDAAAGRSLSVLEVRRNSLDEMSERIRRRTLRFGTFLDRASDEDETFLPLVRLLQKPRHGNDDTVPSTRVINPPQFAAKASDKATMHLEFLSHNINVPYSIIISPYNHRKEIELTLSELAKLGRPFIVKPANTTGGGIGVVTGAETLKDVLEARQHHRNDKYLLQETIKPATIGTRRAWFRVFSVFGSVFPCWWDDRTHIYEAVSPRDEESLGFGELRLVTRRIYEVCQLDFFSTEIALTTDQRLIAVDYVNEMCDMRLQSRYRDGVPDDIVERIAALIVDSAKATHPDNDSRI